MHDEQVAYQWIFVTFLQVGLLKFLLQRTDIPAGLDPCTTEGTNLAMLMLRLRAALNKHPKGLLQPLAEMINDPETSKVNI